MAEKSLFEYLKECGVELEIVGQIDLTPDPEIEEFLKEKYRNQERAKNCDLKFKLG